MSVKLGANKDVTKDAKKDAIEVEKLGANKGVTLDAKNWAQKWTQKSMQKIGCKNGCKNRWKKGWKKGCNRWHFTKMYNSTRFSAELFTTFGKKVH